MTHAQLRWLGIQTASVMLALVLFVGCTPPRTPEQAMVDARAGFLTATGAFTIYAMQPWCGPPPAPKPPLCADRAIVQEGAKAARAVNSTLDAADAVIAAKGVPDMAAITRALADYAALVAQVRK